MHQRSCKRYNGRFSSMPAIVRLCPACMQARKAMSLAGTKRKHQRGKDHLVVAAGERPLARRKLSSNREAAGAHDASLCVMQDCGNAESSLDAMVFQQAKKISRLQHELALSRAESDRLRRKHVALKQGCCIICEDNRPNILLVPCGHCYCDECIRGVDSCPVCKEDIRKKYPYHPPVYICDEAVLASMEQAKLDAKQKPKKRMKRR